MSKSVFECIDAHTCGNPVRLIAKGAPILQGNNMSEKRQFFLNHFDWIRKGLMFEPRGHDMMSGAILFPPHNSKNDFSILFIETSGCLPMCGHGTIGIVTIALEENLIKPNVEGVLKIEVPAGTIEVNYKMKNEKVEWVEIRNVDSYLADRNLIIHSDYMGEIKFDVSYGGNFYAIIESQKNYFGLKNYRAEELISFSREIRDKINKKYANRFILPIDKSIRDVSHILWTGQVLDNKSSSRNAVFYGDKAIDRSPCGTGSSARMAQLFSQNKLKVGEAFIHESYIGSKFICRIEKSSKIHNIDGISPIIRGWAKIHGYNKIIVDSSDPFYQGFQVI